MEDEIIRQLRRDFPEETRWVDEHMASMYNYPAHLYVRGREIVAMDDDYAKATDAMMAQGLDMLEYGTRRDEHHVMYAHNRSAKSVVGQRRIADRRKAERRKPWGVLAGEARAMAGTIDQWPVRQGGER